MPHIVTDRCVDCKHTVCVSVCPVDCFHEGEDRLWIDPEECIDCAACVPECPEEAIFALENLPPGHEEDIALNEEMSKILPVIMEEKPPDTMADHCKKT